MRFAIITDLHGYYPGLSAFIEDIQDKDVEEIVCLGDIVDGGGSDLDVIDWLRENKVKCVRGNHDENNDLNLPTEYEEWLRHLPVKFSEKGIMYVHDSPRTKNDKIKDRWQAWNSFDDAEFDFCMVGHSHFPMVYRYRQGMGPKSEEIPLINTRHYVDSEFRYLVVVPSLAYNRSIDERPGYAMCDLSEGWIEFRFLNIESLQEELIRTSNF